MKEHLAYYGLDHSGNPRWLPLARLRCREIMLTFYMNGTSFLGHDDDESSDRHEMPRFA